MMIRTNFVMCAVLSVLVAHALPEKVEDFTLDDFNTLYTNAMAQGMKGVDSRLFAMFKRPEFRDTLLEYDRQLASKGIHFTTLTDYRRWPKTTEVSWVATGAYTNMPTCYSVFMNKGRAAGGSEFWLLAEYATFDETVSMFAERLVSHFKNGYPIAVSQVGSYRKMIQDKGIRQVKYSLRKKGKSFITKNGVNPCEAPMGELTAALNAPLFAGLNEWLQTYSSNARIPMELLPSQKEITDLRDKILYGEVDMTWQLQSSLNIGLGIEAYNAFVKEYNGD